MRVVTQDRYWQKVWFGPNGEMYRYPVLPLSPIAESVVERSDDLGQTFVKTTVTPDSLNGAAIHDVPVRIPITVIDVSYPPSIRPVAQWRTPDGREIVAGMVKQRCVAAQYDGMVLFEFQPDRQAWRPITFSHPRFHRLFPDTNHPICRYMQGIARIWVDPDDPTVIVAMVRTASGSDDTETIERQLLWTRDGGETWFEGETFLGAPPLIPMWNGQRWTVMFQHDKSTWINNRRQREVRIVHVDPRHPTTPVRDIQMPDMVVNDAGHSVWRIDPNLRIYRQLIMATVPDTPTTVIIVHPVTAKVYRSDDAGRTWMGPITWDGPTEGGRRYERTIMLGYDPFRQRMVLSVMSPLERLYAVATSPDGGRTWEADWSPSAGHTWFYRDPVRPHIGYAASPFYPAIRTMDGGQTWTVIASKGHPFENTELYRMILVGPYHFQDQVGNEITDLTDLTRPVRIIPNRTFDHTVPRVFGIIRLPDGRSRWYGLAPRPVPSDEGDNGWPNGWFISDDTGRTWRRDPMIGLPMHFHDVSPIFQNPQTPNVLLVGNFGRIFRSTDYGATWERVPIIRLPGHELVTDDIIPELRGNIVVDPTDPTRWYVVRYQEGGSVDITCGEPNGTGYTIRTCASVPPMVTEDGRLNYVTILFAPTGEPGRTRWYAVSAEQIYDRIEIEDVDIWVIEGDTNGTPVTRRRAPLTRLVENSSIIADQQFHAAIADPRDPSGKTIILAAFEWWTEHPRRWCVVARLYRTTDAGGTWAWIGDAASTKPRCVTQREGERGFSESIAGVPMIALAGDRVIVKSPWTAEYVLVRPLNELPPPSSDPPPPPSSDPPPPSSDPPPPPPSWTVYIPLVTNRR